MSEPGDLTLINNSPEKVFLGDELNLDLWVETKTVTDKSMLIRKTSPDGETASVLLHLSDEKIKVIPSFLSNAGNSLTTKTTPASKSEVTYSTPSKISFNYVKYGSVLLALIFFIFSATGVFQTRVILTGSMKPTLKPGDVVFALSPKLISPQVGKTVIYTARDLNGRAVTQWAHRIISGDSSKGWIIKGDANPAADINTVPTTDISSVVLFSIPFVGKFFNPMTLILFGIGLLILIFILSRIKE